MASRKKDVACMERTSVAERPEQREARRAAAVHAPAVHQTAVPDDHVAFLTWRNGLVFECFPYVCPEPVLVKWCILALKVGKRDRFLTRELYSRVLGAIAVATERGVRLLAPELLPRRAACIYIVRKRRVWMSFHRSIEHRSVLPGQAWNKHTQNINEDTVSAVPKLPSICEG